MIRLGKAQISGSYSVSTSSSPNTTFNDFELNFYADLIYSHTVLFHVDEENKITFGKTENYRFLFKKIKGQYTYPPNDLATDLKNYVNPKLFGAVVAKIFEEVKAKVSLDNVGFQIKNEVAFKYRNFIAGRFKKAISDAFADVYDNLYFNIFYSDKTNFHVSMIEIPTSNLLRPLFFRVPTLKQLSGIFGRFSILQNVLLLIVLSQF